MADFSSDFWNVYVAVITVVSIVGCGIFLFAQTKRRTAGDKVDTTGHVWDETLAEYNNPLPRWWMWLFYITIVFSLAYLAFYPGLGSFSGSFGWSSKKQFDEEVAKANAQFGPLYDKYLKMELTAVAADPQAREMGQRLFLNHCAQCHGSDAGGSRGFPSLRDGDWLWGGAPELIKTSIAEGRSGVMPPQAAAVGGSEDVKDVANHVLSLSGRTHDELRAQRGKAKFMVCAACHGPEGKGNPQLGAPNLTDKIWLYGGSEATIIETITKGRNGIMPAHKDSLGEAKVHLLAAYVMSLGKGGEAAK
ncbi:MAG: cytochrome-c oxidase, cbb3-type subunit III [Betaproteobacteria bacterium]|nr:MAG: cytochrome-c oxidase, cbb3-type subunit III [Betaproteobacteria bacterium]